MMKRGRAICLVTLVFLKLVYAVSTEHVDDDEIDPNDLLHFDPVNMRMIKDVPKTETTRTPPSTTPLPTVESKKTNDVTPGLKDGDKTCSIAEKSYSEVMPLLRQFSMTLVNHLESKVTSREKVEINLRLQVNSDQITKLKNFGQKKNSDVHETFEILRSVVHHASDVLDPVSKFYWLEDKLGLSTQSLLQIIASVALAIAVVKMLCTTVITLTLAFRALFLMFVVSVVFTWIEMYQVELAEQERIFLDKMAKSCPQPDEGIWSAVKSFLSSTFKFKDNKCQKYYQAMLVNPVTKVSPMEAIAVAVVKTVVAPAGIVGQAISDFLTALLKDLPFHFQLIVPVLLIVLPLFTLAVIRGYSINILHLINIGPAPHNSIAPAAYPPIQHVPIAQPPIHQAPSLAQAPVLQSSSEPYLLNSNAQRTEAELLKRNFSLGQISKPGALQYSNAPVPENQESIQVQSCVRQRNVDRSQVIPATRKHETHLQSGSKAGDGTTVGTEEETRSDSADVPPVQEQTCQSTPPISETVSCECVQEGGRSEETTAMEECSGWSMKAEDETMETTEQSDLSQSHEIARKLKDLNIADGCQEMDLISS
ncbi:chloride channel CLIC-like protein 1 [Physella acuta]|uniref:chloride channel CLIC-like protein 1 n=1 Tax=Physella acuta TaxID=109671 RepID=UPI0027DD6AE7|nr:chloride channel CLIC-like protein 1 [Physella acuta]